jgi:hypothetical protein
VKDESTVSVVSLASRSGRAGRAVAKEKKVTRRSDRRARIRESMLRHARLNDLCRVTSSKVWECKSIAKCVMLQIWLRVFVEAG